MIVASEPSFDPTNPNPRFLEDVSARTAGVSRLECASSAARAAARVPRPGHGPHAPDALRDDPRRDARPSAREQHAVDLCLLLPLRRSPSARARCGASRPIGLRSTGLTSL